MTELSQDTVRVSEQAVLLHGNGDFSQCAAQLKILQKQLMEVDR